MATYIKPVKRVVSPEDLDIWIGSETYEELLEFIVKLQELVVGLENDYVVKESEKTKGLLELLDKVEGVIASNPVVIEKDISRFGKVEFRDFYEGVCDSSEVWLQELLEGVSDLNCVIEVATYFNESWGDKKRIDYGSGHELNFIFFLLCLYKLGIVKEVDFSFLILKVFTKYISIMRSLQKTYWLEPAGSHGVWGLDDYHFLPFLFGSSQLSTHPHMKPKLIHNTELVELYYTKYMYLECIHFINTIKTTPKNQDQKLSLRWHSPMLDDILSAKSWMKIKEGMVKMYKAEVLNKLPVVQHIMFGSIIKCPEGVSEAGAGEPEDDCGHSHNAINTWQDCCGIKIPSAIAASESLKLENKKAHKPIPFD